VISIDTAQEGWRIAKAAKTEKGIVLEYRVPGDARLFEVQKSFMRVFTITNPELQSKARKLLGLGNPIIRDTHKEMCDAILAA